MSESTPIAPVAFESDRPQEVWIIQPPRQRLWLHIVLLAATFLTTTLVGAHMQSNFANHLPVFAMDDDLFSFVGSAIQQSSLLLRGLPFSLTLMFILLAHEMGHYLYARHYRVYATLPYFIPFPSLIGTMGAFIRIKSPIPSRDALFDIGIAGPIAGFIPSCAAVATGLLLSQPLPPGDAAASNPLGLLPLVFHVAARVLHIATPLAALSLHPISAAGWVGMFATSLNLLPGGQLDGGHILYSVSPKFHRWVSLLTVVALLPLAKYFWMGWLLWAVVLWLTSYHPPVPSQSPISASRKATAILGVVMLALSLTPEPLAGTSGRDAAHWLRDTSRRLIYRN
jgi:membrane-associated protease RseP (regulator of RpoE activity)